VFEIVQVPALSLFLAILALILVAGAFASFRVPEQFRHRARFRSGKNAKPFGFDFTDPAQQLNFVMRANFQKRKILSAREYSVFKIIEDDLANARSGYRIFAQTCLGEILKPSDQLAFHSINSKRVDMLIVDRGGWPVAAIEYQGDGHYQGTAAARDAVKKEALRKAGVRYIEVGQSDTEEQIRYRLREVLGPNVFRNSAA